MKTILGILIKHVSSWRRGYKLKEYIITFKEKSALQHLTDTMSLKLKTLPRLWI